MGLFFKDDEKKSSKKEDKKTGTPPNNGNSEHKATITVASLESFGQTQNTQTDTAPAGTKKSEYLKFLRDLMIKNPGPYENLVVAIEKMKTQPIDEATKFRNVYSTLEAVSGITIDQLLTSAQNYKKLFDNTKASFDKDMVGHKQSQSTQIDQLKKANATIDSQMANLNQTKLENEKKIQGLQDISSHLVSQENDFNSAFTDSQAEIDRTVDLINKYLTSSVAQ